MTFMGSAEYKSISEAEAGDQSDHQLAFRWDEEAAEDSKVNPFFKKGNTWIMKETPSDYVPSAESLSSMRGIKRTRDGTPATSAAARAAVAAKDFGASIGATIGSALAEWLGAPPPPPAAPPPAAPPPAALPTPISAVDLSQERRRESNLNELLEMNRSLLSSLGNAGPVVFALKENVSLSNPQKAAAMKLFSDTVIKFAHAVLNPKDQDHDLAKNISSLVIGSGDDAFAIVDAVMGDQAELVLPRENPFFLTQSALFAFSPGFY